MDLRQSLTAYGRITGIYRPEDCEEKWADVQPVLSISDAVAFLKSPYRNNVNYSKMYLDIITKHELLPLERRILLADHRVSVKIVDVIDKAPGRLWTEIHPCNDVGEHSWVVDVSRRISLISVFS